MKCPKCVQKIHRRAQQCPHCGFSVSELDAVYGWASNRARKLNDEAGVLRMRDRRKAGAWFEHFEKSFPQLFFSVHFGELGEEGCVRQFGMWQLNQANYEDVDDGRGRNGGVLLVVDVLSKTATITFGYLLDRVLTDEDTFDILSRAHPYLLDGDYLRGLRIVMRRLTVVLRKKSLRVKRRAGSWSRAIGSRICFWSWGRVYDFPALDSENSMRRLSADYAAGVGAIIEFQNHLASPSSQRDLDADFLSKV